jgi:hypothetical protein
MKTNLSFKKIALRLAVAFTLLGAVAATVPALGVATVAFADGYGTGGGGG